MLRYFIRRMLWAVVLFVAVTLVTFLIFFIVPQDPARQVCGQRATATCIERARHFLGLDKPVIVQYGRSSTAWSCTDRSAGRSRRGRT